MKIITTYSNELIKALQNGAVGIMPTDTVYGLVCQASNRQAVERLYKLKAGRNKPGTVIAANIDQLVKLGLTYRYIKAVSQFWPGPTSVIIPSGEELKYIHLGLNGIAVRLPDKPSLLNLLIQTGPLLTTSANPPGKATAIEVKEAQKVFKDRVDFYVDGGNLSNHLPSTVVRLVDDFVEVVRQGATSS